MFPFAAISLVVWKESVTETFDFIDTRSAADITNATEPTYDSMGPEAAALDVSRSEDV
jgi:hypothetical protein